MVLPGATDGIVHFPVAALYVPTDAVAVPTVIPAGIVIVTSKPVAVAVPSFCTVTTVVKGVFLATKAPPLCETATMISGCVGIVVKLVFSKLTVLSV